LENWTGYWVAYSYFLFTIDKVRTISNCSFPGLEPDRITEKLIHFFEILIAISSSRPFCWKTHPYKFHEYLFSFGKISGHELGRIAGKLIHICTEYGLCQASELVKYYFPAKYFFLNEISNNTVYFMPQYSDIDDWMSFPVIRSSSCPEKLPIRVNYNLFSTSIGIFWPFCQDKNNQLMKYHHLILQIISSFGLFSSICGIASLHSQGQLKLFQGSIFQKYLNSLLYYLFW